MIELSTRAKSLRLALLFAAGVWPASAPQAGEPVLEAAVGACYSAGFDRANGPLKQIVGRISRSQVEGASPYELSLSFTQWDVPNDLFDSVAGCTLSGDSLNCSIECDGGHAIVTAGDDGRLFVQTSGLRYGMTGDESLLSVNDADGGVLTGLYALSPAPANEDCKPSEDHVFAALEAGDISPRVQGVETMLNRIGQFLEFPDTVFDETTAAAVAGFQKQYGLDQSGRVDEPTAAALLTASSALGGC